MWVEFIALIRYGELLHEMVPQANVVALLVNPSTPARAEPPY